MHHTVIHFAPGDVLEINGIRFRFLANSRGSLAAHIEFCGPIRVKPLRRELARRLLQHKRRRG